jgi:Raf kinase inhibitor-like YbhB/YbcL family protein
MTMTLTSTAFPHGGTIPRRCSCDGENLSPPLSWSGVPSAAQSLLLVCDDPDAPSGVFHHWAVYDIPVSWKGLPEGLAPSFHEGGVRQAVNDFGKPGYGGPCPPRGDRPHRYRFRLSALDGSLSELPQKVRCSAAAEAAKPHVLASAELVGLYGRSR